MYIQFLVQNFVTFDIGGRYTSKVNSFREFYNDNKGTSDEESAYVEREESRRVMSAIQQLAPDEADLLSLVVSSGLSYHQIAELTGTSEGNIKVRIHRCRQKLKKILHTGET